MRLLTATALALSLPVTAALAQSDTAATPMHSSSSADRVGMQRDLIRSQDITGGAVYTPNQADDEGWDPNFSHNAIDPNCAAAR